MMNNSGRFTISQGAAALLMSILTVLAVIPGLLLVMVVRAYYAALAIQKQH